MARRARPGDSDQKLRLLFESVQQLPTTLAEQDLRSSILALISTKHHFEDLAVSLTPRECWPAARDRILYYLRLHVGEVIDGEELAVVSGISEYARRIRELRVQLGWSILSGNTLRDILESASEEDQGELLDLKQSPLDIVSIKPDQYILQSAEPDLDGARRWSLANSIRRNSALSVKEKILRFMRENVGKEVSGEELRYLAGDNSEWARRVRELRTEEGWPIVTKANGNPALPVGVYVLEKDEQAETHDRMIPDSERRYAMQRDNYHCQKCDWHQELWHPNDPRHLEVHHIKYHVNKGTNTADNLVTYCNICHDVVHREEKGTA